MKVSVVIPTYNRVNNLKRALESVLNQTYENLEIIVVSDGSTDGTDNFMNSFRKRDSRIEYVSYFPNKGGNYARNRGIKAAQGEYIAFLDDDDEWEKEKIELQLNEIKKNPNVGLVYTGINIIYNQENINYYSLPKKSGNLSKDILISNHIGTTSSVMVKTDLVHNVGMFDENLRALQDYDLWIRICQKTEVSYVNKPLVRYYNSTSNKQISDDVKKYEDAIEYINKKYFELYSNASPDIKLKHNEAMSMLIFKKHLRNNNNKSARRHLRKHFSNKLNMKGAIYYLLSFLSFKTVLKLQSIVNKY